MTKKSRLQIAFPPTVRKIALGDHGIAEVKKHTKHFTIAQMLFYTSTSLHTFNLAIHHAGFKHQPISTLIWFVFALMIIPSAVYMFYLDAKIVKMNFSMPTEIPLSGKYNSLARSRINELLNEVASQACPPHTLVIILTTFGIKKDRITRLWANFLKILPVKFLFKAHIKRMALVYDATDTLPKATFNKYSRSIVAQAETLGKNDVPQGYLTDIFLGKSPAAKVLNRADDVQFEISLWRFVQSTYSRSTNNGLLRHAICEARIYSLELKITSDFCLAKKLELTAQHLANIYDRMPLNTNAIKDIINNKYSTLNLMLEELQLGD